MTPPTKLSVINRAATRFGERELTEQELTDGATKSAVILGARYDDALVWVLQQYFWRAAAAQRRIEPVTMTEAEADAAYGVTLGGAEQLVVETAVLRKKEDGVYYVAPPTRYKYSFDKPSDMVRLRFVTDKDGASVPYDVEGTKLLSDDSPLYLHYTKELPIGEFPSMLAELLVLRLLWVGSAYMGEASAAKEADYMAEFSALLRFAKNLDAQQDATRHMVPGDWLESRRLASAPPYPNLG